MKYLLLISLMLFGCADSNETINQNIINNYKNQMSYIIYLKDNRTNLCYAGNYLGTQYGVLTNVPCTPEVLELIKQNSSIPAQHIEAK